MTRTEQSTKAAAVRTAEKDASAVSAAVDRAADVTAPLRAARIPPSSLPRLCCLTASSAAY